uniref:Uncharacterized protein n=1 Tax=Arundo donax TaxID=35708 RepID=A0A0A9G586_ARUDO
MTSAFLFAEGNFKPCFTKQLLSDGAEARIKHCRCSRTPSSSRQPNNHLPFGTKILVFAKRSCNCADLIAKSIAFRCGSAPGAKPALSINAAVFPCSAQEVVTTSKATSLSDKILLRLDSIASCISEKTTSWTFKEDSKVII